MRYSDFTWRPLEQLSAESMTVHYPWGFSPQSSCIFGARKVKTSFYQKRGWEDTKPDTTVLPGSLPSPYLLHLISVFFPKWLWHQVPAYLHRQHPVLVCHSHLNYYHDLWAKSNLQVKDFYVFLMVGEKIDR